MVIVLVLSLLSMIFCFIVAKARKANTKFWLIAAILFGPLAVPFVFLSKPVNALDK